MIIWNPWHGCHKVSEGCAHCYMYFLDGKRGSNCIVVFYETFKTSYSYTRIGKVKDTASLKKALGSGDVTIKFE